MGRTQTRRNPDRQGEDCHGGEQRFLAHHAHAELDIQSGDANAGSAVEDGAYAPRESAAGHDSLNTGLRLRARATTSRAEVPARAATSSPSARFHVRTTSARPPASPRPG